MESTSLDDVRLLHGMIGDHQDELLQERTRLDALRIDWSRKSLQASRLRDSQQSERSLALEEEVRQLQAQIAEVERHIAHVEGLVAILRRRQHEL